MSVNKPEISALSNAILGHLGGMYVHALWCLSVPWGQDDFDLNALPESKQKKACKLIRKFYGKEDDDELPEEVTDYMFSQQEPLALLTFFQECISRLRSIGQEEEARLTEVLETLPQDVKQMFIEIMRERRGEDFSLLCHGDTVEILVDDTDAYTRSLILHGVAQLPSQKKGLSISEIALFRVPEGYCLKGEVYNEHTGSYSTFNSFVFTHTEVKTVCYRADRPVLIDNPWYFLMDMAFSICTRLEFPDCWGNEQEQALLPLLKELATPRYPFLTVPYDEDDETEALPLAFPLLKALWEGHPELLSLLNALEQVSPDSPKYDSLSRRLVAKLCMAAYEPLWRELYERISASQAAYPSKVESVCARQTLQDTRAWIKELLAEQGYTGTYPDFVKIAPMKAIHLAESYNLTYWVGWEKRAVHRIRCLETADHDQLSIQFLCCSALGKDKEALEDTFSCTFNAKGKRLCNQVQYDLRLPRRNKAEERDNLQRHVGMAVKRAELRRLSKADRQALQKDPFANRDLWGMFLVWLILGGGFYSIAMTLIGMLAMVLAGEPFSEVIAQPFWWKAFLGMWIGFGGLMGIAMVIVTALSRRK